MRYQTAVIESIFFERFDPASNSPSDRLVTLKQVQEAIVRYNENAPKKVSTRNAANFAKDLWRKHKTANENWPKAVFDAGFTGRPRQGGGNSFQFVPLAPGQTEPVDMRFIPDHKQCQRRVQIESVSLPLASKRLGRNDEPWLIQVLIKLRVFETHLALSSNHDVVQLDHLQTNVKLHGAEIDALFLGIVKLGKNATEFIVCCEAKSLNEDIVPDQILNGVQAAFRSPLEQELIVPIAVKAIGPSEVFVVEFEAVRKADAEATDRLIESTSVVYKLVPPVPGIGHQRSRSKAKG